MLVKSRCDDSYQNWQVLLSLIFLMLGFQLELRVYELVKNVALPVTASVPACTLCRSIPDNPLSNFSR